MRLNIYTWTLVPFCEYTHQAMQIRIIFQRQQTSRLKLIASSLAKVQGDRGEGMRNGRKVSGWSDGLSRDIISGSCN